MLMSEPLKLDAEYHTTRAALIDAGINMSGSIDALYRDWLRWRNQGKSLSGIDSIDIERADRWWSLHLAQFRTLIDPLHVTARAERVRKDRNQVRAKPRPV